MFSIALLLTTLLSSTQPTLAVMEKGRVESIQPTRVVSFIPQYGYATRRVSARLSQTEVQLVRRLQTIAETWNAATPPPGNFITWRIEDQAMTSPTIDIAAQALQVARTLLAIPDGAGSLRVAIIVGRSQAFIRQQLSTFKCEPSVASANGIYLMGATVCNRNVVVINLTGYLFLRSATQTITTQMETRQEPPLGSLSYLIVDRNLSSLAHEWTHVARNRLSGGYVPDNEPAWFREGLAEVTSGLARVRSSQGRYRYAHFHIIRLRKFSDWTKTCNKSISAYREQASTFNGCEYFVGAAAVELLLAKFGGFQKIFDLYANIRISGDFFASFRNTYRISIQDFERQVAVYRSHIAAVSKH